MDSLGLLMAESKYSAKTFSQPEDIRNLNEFKRFLSDSEKHVNKNNPEALSEANNKKQGPNNNVVGGNEVVKKFNDINVPSKSSTPIAQEHNIGSSSLGKGNSPVGLLYTRDLVAKSVKESLLVTYKPVNKFSEGKPNSSEVRFTLQSKGESALIIRGYKKGVDLIIKWVVSKAGATLDSMVVNGKKLMFRVEK